MSIYPMADIQRDVIQQLYILYICVVNKEEIIFAVVLINIVSISLILSLLCLFKE